jgi:hypothetical protein
MNGKTTKKLKRVYNEIIPKNKQSKRMWARMKGLYKAGHIKLVKDSPEVTEAKNNAKKLKRLKTLLKGNALLPYY